MLTWQAAENLPTSSLIFPQSLPPRPCLWMSCTLSQNICAHTCVCAGRRPRCESVRLPGRACWRRRAARQSVAGRTRAPARKHFHLNLLTAQALVHLLHSAERRLSAASVGSSRRLRHLTASVSVRARTHVCVCVCVGVSGTLSNAGYVVAGVSSCSSCPTLVKVIL